MKHFKYPKIYPNEAFVQEAIENYFSTAGFEIKESRHIDLVAEKTNEKWIVEAKGSTSQITVDFNTCLGQLARRMTSPFIKYAIALPYEDNYKHQCTELPDYYRANNNLYIILVAENAQVLIIKPTDDIEANWGLLKLL